MRPAVEQLLTRHGSAAAALAEATAAVPGSAGMPRAPFPEPDQPQWTACRRWLDAPGRQLMTWTDPGYPPLLRETPDAPLLLFVAGDAARLSLPQLAIVGSRSATPGGLCDARAFAGSLAGAGFSICSGLAEGIDTAAHLAALDAGGTTVAVCGTGLDRVYPRRNQALAARIAAEGALVSEFPPGTPPLRAHFPQRNRIISGLSVGTVVIEAGMRSGALITARRAAEQNREVFALPGSIHNPLSRGCHRLIREGAQLVETSGEIVAALGSLLGSLLPAPDHGLRDRTVGLSAAQRRLLDLMGFAPVDTDTLVQRSGLTAAELSSMLLPLELEGLVQSLSGGRLQKIMRNSGS